MKIREVKTLSIYAGEDMFPIDLFDYAFVQAKIYDDRVRIDFFNKNRTIVRQIFDPSADITYV